MTAYLKPSQIGGAADMPSDSQSKLWRFINNLSLTRSTIRSDLGPAASKDGLDPSDLAGFGADPTRSTPAPYVLFGQLVQGSLLRSTSTVARLGASATGEPVDDRKMLLEDVVQFLATTAVKPGHGTNKRIADIQSDFIHLLWNDLPHPPSTFLGNKYRFRQPDDSNNSLEDPTLGASNQPYARSVPPRQILPANVASPEEIFDACLRRPADGFQPHPAGISSLLFAHGLTIIHSIMWSSPKDPNINLAPSYLSLSPLYGTNIEEQRQVRDSSQLGRGLLYPDTFSSARILLMPPAASALLVLWSRNHNRAARKLLELNEPGHWQQDLSNLTEEEKQKQDDEIFGYARNINCRSFVDVTLFDYVQTILGSMQADSDWTLDPRIDLKTLLGRAPSGVGNAVSIEFNVLYRWHAPTSAKDTHWLEDKAAIGRPDRDWDKMTLAEFGRALAAHSAELGVTTGSDHKASGQPTWKLSRYETLVNAQGRKTYIDGVYDRGSDGTFADRDLAKILRDANSEVAGRYGARHIPAVLKAVDCQGMHHGREVWQLATLNEFRKFLNLKTYSTFDEWTSDPHVARAAESLWGHPDNIELYAGLMAESTKEPRVGAGLCPGYSLSRAILSDAVALVRGDRFMTKDASKDTLTQWGLEDVQGGSRLGGYGGVLSKLIRDNLPDQYAFDDVALLFPFMTPTTSMEMLEKIGKGRAANYSIGKRGPAGTQIKLDDLQAQRMRDLTGNPALRVDVALVLTALKDAVTFAGSEWDALGDAVDVRLLGASFARSPAFPKVKSVDVVKDVTTPVLVGWTGALFGLLRTGLHSHLELSVSASNLSLYLHQIPQTNFETRIAAREASAKLFSQFLVHVAATAPAGKLGGLLSHAAEAVGLDMAKHVEGLIRYARDMSAPRSPSVSADLYRRLGVANSGFGSPLSDKELAANCLHAFALVTSALTDALASAIDGLLDGGERMGRAVALASSVGEDLKAKAKLVELALPFVHFNDGDDEQVAQIVGKVLESVLPVVFALPNLRRAPGGQGRLNRIQLSGQFGGVASLVVQYG